MEITDFDEVFNRFKYPAGETHVELRTRDLACRTTTDATLNILVDVRDFNGLCDVIAANRILKRLSITVNWLIPYFPFARHDRRRDTFDGEPLDLAMDLMKEVDPIIVDPHSLVSAKLRHIPQDRVVQAFREHGAFSRAHIFAIPDEGATKKAIAWLGEDSFVQCTKVRDMATGKLSGFSVNADPVTIIDSTVIIVDDICDGGGTFLGLGERLKKMGAAELRLIVTHGLFTKGTDHLRKIFDEIWTMDIYDDKNDKMIITIPVESVYDKGWI